MILNEITYWVTLASMPKMLTKRKIQLCAKCYSHDFQYSIVDLFERPEIRCELGVTSEEEILFATAYQQLANNAFMVEDLLSQGYEIIPINSPAYPRSLIKNLKSGAPCVLYVKGNKDLLKTESTAIVGSRKADSISLEFTENIAKKAVLENKVVVSGFAKGVDRQALDTAIQAHGKSVIVLPQGITTFTSGFRQYYQQIYQGQVTVISIFHPKAAWSKEFAMARNSIIYGLSTEIYVAQSDIKGGTWSGVIEGLKRIKSYNINQKIYVRMPNINEENANLLLIQKGGIGVDMFGNVVANILSTDNSKNYVCSEPENIVESHVNEGSIQNDPIKKRVLNILTGKKMSKEIIAELKLDWSDARMKNFLRALPEVEEVKKSNKIFFFKKGYDEPHLFSNL